VTVDPLAAPCSHCDAKPGQRCMMLSDWARSPHKARVRLALALAADADSLLDAYFPRLGPCGLCGTPGLDQRHRVADAIAGRLEGREGRTEVAEDYGLPLEAMDVIEAWAKRWPGAWL
jgi:hypothetical protein